MTALREINVLLALSHPNIINVREMVVGNSIAQNLVNLFFRQSIFAVSVGVGHGTVELGVH